MKLLYLAYLVVGIASVSAKQKKNAFPKGFIFSSATAAYQVEGAWNEGGKGENIWDRLLHTTPNFTLDSSNGDVACDSYHNYNQDIAMLKYIGFDMYRFSLSWARILPNGESYNINQEGVDYYMKVIEGLIANGIQPMVTLYHWDLPQKLQDLGGWTNPLMVDYFREYARVCFSLFGDKVKYWITINEPFEVTRGYDSDAYAPNLGLHGTANYLVAHNLIKAHAAAYRLYEKEFKAKQNGKLSLSINGNFNLPKTNSSEDIEAAERRNQFQFGLFAHPVYTAEGDYPKIMRQIIDENSKKEGRAWSRLPVFTPEEINYIKGTFDFFGLNHYTSDLTEEGTSGEDPSWERDTNTVISADPQWPTTVSDGFSVVPDGLRAELNWLKNQYNNVPIFITENGFVDVGGTNDKGRINYFKGYIGAVSDAITEDGCNIIGYTIWSLMDNFEWKKGYTFKYGIYQVDFSSPKRTRTPKKSAQYVKNFLKKVHAAQ